MSTELILKIATPPRIFIGASASILGMVTGESLPQTPEAHWLQLATWLFAATAGMATTLLVLVRLVIMFWDWYIERGDV